MEDTDEENMLPQGASAKKRPKLGRVCEVKKKLLLSTHEIGPDCNCSRLKCFSQINCDDRRKIITHFNSMSNYDEQNLHLSGLITTHPVARRRPRKDKGEADLHNNSYQYKVRISRENKVMEVQICYKAFLSLHGITGRRVQSIQASLRTTGRIQKDGRGKHSNRPNKISEDTLSKVLSHIQSLKGRHAHYSLHDSKRLYLPEELNIKKLHDMYSELNPKNHVSYETYRTIFNTKFNISFGYPRTDTCSSCDEFKAKLNSLEADLAATHGIAQRKLILKSIKKIQVENDLHKRRADTFYRKKREVRKESQKSLAHEGICMDFQKNLKLPNISTNDVYYKRQLSYYLFNIHILSNSKSVFYVYDETTAKKGSDEVSSMLYDFIMFHLPNTVRHLTIFCDSCGGQNKNYNVFRFLYYMVHQRKLLDTVNVIFPVRGHSYMECDRNMALVNQRHLAQIPKDWTQHLRTIRQKPSPFVVEECDQDIFRNWSDFFKSAFKPKCPFASRPIKELKIEQDQAHLIFYRDTYNGAFTSCVITLPRGKRNITKLLPGEFEFPSKLYYDRIPIPLPKFKDLQVLKRFCESPEAQKYYEQLPCIRD